MRWYASYGITTAQDGISSPTNIALINGDQGNPLIHRFQVSPAKKLV